MKIALVYTRVQNPAPTASCTADQYEEGARRFANTLYWYPPGVDYELVVVQCSPEPFPMRGASDSFYRFYCRVLHYPGKGRDCGAYQFAARNLHADWIVGFNAHTHFNQRDWLQPFLGAMWSLGPGLYGPSASYEITPHIRTPCIAFPTSVMREYPYELTEPHHANSAECGEWSLTKWFLEKNLPVRCVLRDRAVELPHWRDEHIHNIFRRGDQTNQLVWDRAHDVYADASPEEKVKLSNAADGK